MWLTRLTQEIEDDVDLDGEEGAHEAEGSEDEDDEDDAIPISLVPVKLPDRLEWEIVEKVFPISLHKLNRLLFDHDSLFAPVFFRAKGYSEISVEPWSDDGKRVVKYLIARSGLVKANHATEVQEYVVKGNGAYVVSVTSTTPEVPFGSTFEIHLQFALVPDGPTAANTRLTITAQMHWIGSTMMKRMIANGARTGMISCYKLYTSELSKFLASKKRKMRRTISNNHLSSHEPPETDEAGTWHPCLAPHARHAPALPARPLSRRATLTARSCRAAFRRWSAAGLLDEERGRERA